MPGKSKSRLEEEVSSSSDESQNPQKLFLQECAPPSIPTFAVTCSQSKVQPSAEALNKVSKPYGEIFSKQLDGDYIGEVDDDTLLSNTSILFPINSLNRTYPRLHDVLSRFFASFTDNNVLAVANSLEKSGCT